MMIKSIQDLGTFIRNRRKALGYTQAQLADYCGCNIMTISSIERGKATAQIGLVLKIVHTLGADLSVKER